MSKRKHIKENFHLDDDDEKGVEAPVHKFDIAETEFDRRKIKQDIVVSFNESKRQLENRYLHADPSSTGNSLVKFFDDKIEEKLEFIDDFNLEGDDLNLIKPELLEKHESVNRGEIKKFDDLTV